MKKHEKADGSLWASHIFFPAVWFLNSDPQFARFTAASAAAKPGELEHCHDFLPRESLVHDLAAATKGGALVENALENQRNLV